MITPVETLLQRIAARDEGALTALYEEYAGRVFNLALQVLRDRTHAEEVTQDVFLQLWHSPDRYDPARGEFSTWLLSITRYSAIDRLRKERRQPALTATPLDQMAQILGQQAVIDQPHWDNGRLLRELIQELPKEQRQAIHLAFFRGMTHSEIAEHMNAPLGTVKGRIRLGLQQLKTRWLAAVEAGGDDR